MGASLMTTVLTIAVLTSISLTVAVLLFKGGEKVQGGYPLSRGAFVAVLFCSGLDVGLIMFPLTEYPVYEKEAEYAFAHPLAIELGMWGLVIWSFYFLTAYYFLCLEPRLKLFENKWVNAVNSLIIVATCSFTAFLFMKALPTYVPDMPEWFPYAVTGVVILMSCYSASDVVFMKWLSILSMWGFFALTLGMWIYSGGDVVKFGRTFSHYQDYFTNIHRFVTPITAYHEFYLFWWFSWSIMIGQFMAKFASPTTVRMLAVLMIIIPSIPLSIWFTVLYIYHADKVAIPGAWSYAMVFVGIVFVVNSLDSLIRLYTDNYDFSVKRFGKWQFIGTNFLVMVALTAAYQFLNFQIQHVGLVVIALYAFVLYRMVAQKRSALATG